MMIHKLLLFSSIVISLNAFDYHLEAKKVTDNTYCFFGKLETISKKNAGNMVNSCFIQTKEGFVVIDSGPTYSYAKQAYEQMQKIAKLPVKYVINTHIHDDHWLGNSFFKSKGALLIGPGTYEQNVAVGMQTRIGSILGKDLFGKTSIVKLDTIVDNNLTISLGEKLFQIKQLEPIAHTKGDLIVYVPQSKTLFVGDLVFGGRLTSLRDGSLIGSLEALDKIENYHAKYIIGGHGEDVSPEGEKAFKTYLLTIKNGILKALDEDIGLEKVTKVLAMPQYKEMKLYDALHSRNVLHAYRELEMMDDEDE